MEFSPNTIEEEKYLQQLIKKYTKNPNKKPKNQRE